jgi:sigma-B regulation protein RsbU (phosphoserine phosphatase)
VPLVVLSSKEDPEVKVAAFVAGANDYLVKLPHQSELVARIRYHRATISAARSRGLPPPGREPAANEIDQALRALAAAGPGAQPIRVDWRSSLQLARRQLRLSLADDDHFAMYLLDVSGHGWARRWRCRP